MANRKSTASRKRKTVRRLPPNNGLDICKVWPAMEYAAQLITALNDLGGKDKEAGADADKNRIETAVEHIHQKLSAKERQAESIETRSAARAMFQVMLIRGYMHDLNDRLEMLGKDRPGLIVEGKRDITRVVAMLYSIIGYLRKEVLGSRSGYSSQQGNDVHDVMGYYMAWRFNPHSIVADAVVSAAGEK